MKGSPSGVLTLPLDIAEEERVLAGLRRGQVILHPTETVYGLGARLAETEAQQRIFAMKGRGMHQPLLVLIPDLGWVDRLCHSIPESAWNLARNLWPGPLTLVLPARDVVPEGVRGGGTTVGIRISSHPLVRWMVESVGPLTSTSANRSGLPSPQRLEEVTFLPPGPDIIVDGGPLRGRGSTILGMEADGYRVIRRGDLPLEAVERWAPGSRMDSSDEPPAAPGAFSPGGRHRR